MDIVKLCEQVIREALDDEQELIPTPYLPSVVALVEHNKKQEAAINFLLEIVEALDNGLAVHSTSNLHKQARKALANSKN